ncbi:MAG TPA: hypothetical protein VN541_14410, partial [Tepidisphaeraceae bacterium]|nr:hypothetical protein [Tepidisphaeraceae bacterium]
MVVADGRLFFTDGTLWTSDGTSAGTHLVTQINPATLSSNPAPTTDSIDINGIEYFFVRNGNSGPELWKTDGTQSTLIASIPGAGYDTQMKDVNGLLYFVAPGTLNYDLWRSDGTPAGTRQVSDVRITNGYGNANPGSLTVFNGNLYFFGRQPNSSTIQIYRTDGVTGQTSAIEPVPQDARVSAPGPYNGPMLAAGGNTLLLNMADSLYSLSDAGTNVPVGTYSIREVTPSGYAQTLPTGYAAEVASTDAPSSGPAFGNVLLSSVTM